MARIETGRVSGNTIFKDIVDGRKAVDRVPASVVCQSVGRDYTGNNVDAVGTEVIVYTDNTRSTPYMRIPLDDAMKLSRKTGSGRSSLGSVVSAVTGSANLASRAVRFFTG